MGLTVAERNHWKERIEKRIDRAIREVYSTEDPTLLQRVHEEARQQAIASLGLRQLWDKRKAIAEKLKSLENERTLVTRRIVAVLRKQPIEEVELGYFGGTSLPSEVKTAIAAATEPHEHALLAATALGRRVLELRQEKEQLLDTVWLATSSSQIKTLWSQVCEQINQPSTPLQTKALTIPSIDSDA